MSLPPLKITILGAGRFGLTLAWLWQKNNHSVTVWHYKSEVIQVLQKNPVIENPFKVSLPKTIQFQGDLTKACENADIIVLAVTTKATQTICEQLTQISLKTNTVILNVSKGLVLNASNESLMRGSDVINHYLPQRPLAVLSGPCLAKEILMGLPTAATIASNDETVAKNLMQHLSVDSHLRLYANTDVLGESWAAALKNIYAIGSGFLLKNNLGENALAAYLTRALSEMTRFAISEGAKPETVFGLSGLGDLLATCHSPNSRNYQLGEQLAEGLKLDEALQKINGPAEGVQTTLALNNYLNTKQKQIEMPIASVIYELLQNQLSAKEMLNLLMLRELKLEVV